MKLRLSVIAIIGYISILFSPQEAAAARSYAENSVLSQGSWTKIRVKETGVCKLTYDQIRGMGFNNPKDVHIYGYGGALLSENFDTPKTDDLSETPVYDSGSAIYFYAQGPRKWVYRGINKQHIYDINSNPYSSYGYYFLTSNTQKKNTIPLAQITPNSEDESEITTYLEHIGHKKEEINTIHSGTGWLGDQIPFGQNKKFEFNIPDIDTYQLASAYLSLAAYSQAKSKCIAIVNKEQNQIDFAYSESHMGATAAEKTIQWVPEESQNDIILSYIATNGTDNMWVEQIVVCAYRELKIRNGIMYFRNPETDSPGTFKYKINGASKNTIIWNITNPQNIEQLQTTFEGNSTMTFRREPKQLEEFVAFEPTSNNFIKAELVGKINNQNLHSIKDKDFIIISHESFLSEAQRLAEIHEDYDNVSTLIVTPEEIYNEFSSGTPDPSAIRWFLKMFYDRGEKEKTVLLFGDGSFDNRGIMKDNNTVINNFIITYQGGHKYTEPASFVTDDYFCFLNDTNNKLPNSGRKMDYSIGRFPVSSIEQATNMVNKVENHLKNYKFGKWHNKVCLVADDNDGTSTVNKFFSYSDDIAKLIKKEDNSMEIQKIHLDSYSRVSGSNGNRYPEVEELIQKNIQEGVLVMNYIGHSSELAWSAERIFTQSQAATIYNDKQGFWFTASCQFTKFDDIKSSGGEDIVLNPNGGAITIFSAARTVFDDRNDNLNRMYIKELFRRDKNKLPQRIGEICRKAKDSLENDSNKMSFTLLGDPMLRINMPQGNVLTDSIIKINGGVIDTLKALSEVKVYGHIEDMDGNFMENFNGQINITLYDKEVYISTKGNCFPDEVENEKNRHKYYDRINKLFSGRAEVNNGMFSFVMKIPKDIIYSFGKGRLHYYAVDEDIQYDADGYTENFIIGGSEDNITMDNCGPDITMYINNNGFLSGDKVNNTPVLYANIKDINGINSSGNGIGHDITLTINGNSDPIILNNDFNYDLDSYSTGTINYQFSKLDPGEYTATLKVWDLVNNSSQKTISFVVDDQKNIRTDNVEITTTSNGSGVSVKVKHDMPSTVQSYRFIIYNSIGVIVKETQQTKERISQGTTWEWDLTDNCGKKVQEGVFLVRVEFETEDGEFYGKTAKMIINKQ